MCQIIFLRKEQLLKIFEKYILGKILLFIQLFIYFFFFFFRIQIITFLTYFKHHHNPDDGWQRYVYAQTNSNVFHVIPILSPLKFIVIGFHFMTLKPHKAWIDGQTKIIDSKQCMHFGPSHDIRQPEFSRHILYFHKHDLTENNK